MAPLHGRLLVPTVLRPFGEHLAALAGPAGGDVCVDVGCEGAVMPALLGRSNARICIAASDAAETLDDARDELSLLHVQNAALIRAHADALPLHDGCAQVVTALFSLPHQRDPVAALREMLRILDPHHGRLAVAMWSEPGAVPHLSAAGGEDGPAHAFGHAGAAEHLVEQAGGTEGITVSRIHDVVRFDGLSHWWAAVAGDTPAPPPARAAEILQPFVAPDGTLRIPCEAVVLATTER